MEIKRTWRRIAAALGDLPLFIGVCHYLLAPFGLTRTGLDLGSACFYWELNITEAATKTNQDCCA